MFLWRVKKNTENFQWITLASVFRRENRDFAIKYVNIYFAFLFVWLCNFYYFFFWKENWDFKYSFLSNSASNQKETNRTNLERWKYLNFTGKSVTFVVLATDVRREPFRQFTWTLVGKKAAIFPVQCAFSSKGFFYDVSADLKPK